MQRGGALLRPRAAEAVRLFFQFSSALGQTQLNLLFFSIHVLVSAGYCGQHAESYARKSRDPGPIGRARPKRFNPNRSRLDVPVRRRWKLGGLRDSQPGRTAGQFGPMCPQCGLVKFGFGWWDHENGILHRAPQTGDPVVGREIGRAPQRVRWACSGSGKSAQARSGQG